MSQKCESSERQPRRCRRGKRQGRHTELDCLRQMEVYRNRPDVLWRALHEMGVEMDGLEASWNHD